MREAGSWVVEGIGEDFVPPNCDLSLVAEAHVVPDGEALHTARELLLREGVLAGSSSGTLIAAALSYCRAQTEPKRVVTFVCDSGNKYLSKMFNDYWMIEQGFVERKQHGDLRDLITRRADEGGVVSVAPSDTLLIAYGRMRLYDVSQLPVMDEGDIVGIVDESDILLAVHRHPDRFGGLVREVMSSRLELVSPAMSIDDLLPVFRGDHVALIVEDGRFLGLITKVDLLNHLRLQIP